MDLAAKPAMSLSEKARQRKLAKERAAADRSAEQPHEALGQPAGPPPEALRAQEILAQRRALRAREEKAAAASPHRELVDALCAMEVECGRGSTGKAKLGSAIGMLIMFADTLIQASLAKDTVTGRTIKVDASFNMRIGRLTSSQRCMEALGFSLSRGRDGKQQYVAGQSIVSVRRIRAMTTSKELITLFAEGSNSRGDLNVRLAQLEAAVAGKAGSKGEHGTLHVGGIQGEIEDEAKLKELFGQFGAVETVTLRRRREGKKVSWALVTYREADSVARALTAHELLGQSHDLVVRMVDTKQARGSTGAMSQVMDRHKSKFTALAQQRRAQRQATATSSSSAHKTAAIVPTETSSGDKQEMTLSEKARQRKLQKLRQGSPNEAKVTQGRHDSVERTLHVGGIQGEIEDEAKLKELFGQFGAVETVTLRRRREGKKVSWALVTYREADSVAQATAAETELSESRGLVVRAMDQDKATQSTGAMSTIVTNKFLELAKTRKKMRLEQGLQKTGRPQPDKPGRDTAEGPPPPPLPLSLGLSQLKGTGFSSRRTPTKAGRTSPSTIACLSPPTATALNMHGSPRAAPVCSLPDSADLSSGSQISRPNLFAPSGAAPGDMVEVTEVKQLSALDRQLQAALDVIQAHADSCTVQRASFTAVWNLIARSKKRNETAPFSTEGNDSTTTVAIQRLLMGEALRVLAAEDKVLDKYSCDMRQAVLGAVWAMLHGTDTDGVLQQEARSREAHRLVQTAIQDARGTSRQDARAAELGELVLECLGY
eukprot:COSAG02_NODE_1549_length_11966_cov_3.777282_5_plen_772_part_00